MKYERPSWDESHMLFAILAATRSSCLIRQCGAALVRDKRVIASGYNGAPPNIRTCLENDVCFYQSLAHQDSEKGLGLYVNLKEQRKSFCRVIHAEENAVNQCSRYGPTADGSTMYVTNFPCPHCTTSVIIPNGIVKVVVWKEYLRNKLLTIDEYSASKSLLDEAKIEIVKLDLSPERMKEIFELTFSVGDRTDYRFNPDQRRLVLE